MFRVAAMRSRKNFAKVRKFVVICHDERIAKKCLDMRCPVPKGTHMEALGWYVISREELLDKHGTC